MKYLKKLKIEFVNGEFENPVKGQVREPAHVFSVFKDMKDWTKETVIGVYLSEKLEVNSYEVLSVGGMDVALLLPDEVFRGAILSRSRNIILIHNHPSGNITPSLEDRQMMKLMISQAEVMRCRILDFIIVGEDGYWSMFEEQFGSGFPFKDAA